MAGGNLKNAFSILIQKILNKTVLKDQGTANAGKFLVVDNNGNVSLVSQSATGSVNYESTNVNIGELSNINYDAGKSQLTFTNANGYDVIDIGGGAGGSFEYVIGDPYDYDYTTFIPVGGTDIYNHATVGGTVNVGKHIIGAIRDKNGKQPITGFYAIEQQHVSNASDPWVEVMAEAGTISTAGTTAYPGWSGMWLLDDTFNEFGGNWRITGTNTSVDVVLLDDQGVEFDSVHNINQITVQEAALDEDNAYKISSFHGTGIMITPNENFIQRLENDENNIHQNAGDITNISNLLANIGTTTNAPFGALVVDYDTTISTNLAVFTDATLATYTPMAEKMMGHATPAEGDIFKLDYLRTIANSDYMCYIVYYQGAWEYKEITKDTGEDIYSVSVGTNVTASANANALLINVNVTGSKTGSHYAQSTAVLPVYDDRPVTTYVALSEWTFVSNWFTTEASYRNGVAVQPIKNQLSYCVTIAHKFLAGSNIANFNLVKGQSTRIAYNSRIITTDGASPLGINNTTGAVAAVTMNVGNYWTPNLVLKSVIISGSENVYAYNASNMDIDFSSPTYQPTSIEWNSITYIA